MKSFNLLAFLLPFMGLTGCKSEASHSNDQVLPGENLEQALQEKLINAQDGDVIRLPEGKFSIRRELSLEGVPNVTIKGAGMDKTVLSFKEQIAGAQGLLIQSSDGIVLEDFTVEDSKGDAIKLLSCDRVTLRGVNTRWTTGAKNTNGGYGLYPVSCTNVLMENCEASYASDAGIYVGQSTNVIVRNNYVHHNVAGLEIENTRHADVYNNTVTGNTGGLLIFDMPDLPQANGYQVKVHDNTVEDNNFENFAAPGAVVSTLPPGTGMLVMAHKEVEIFNNVIRKHKTTALSITSWVFTGKPFESAEYDPFCSALYIHDNNISETQGPSDTSTEFGQVLTALTKGQGVDIAIDGIFNPASLGENGLPAGDAAICLRNNGAVSFVNINAAQGKGPEEWAQVMSNDPTPFDCSGHTVTLTDWLVTK